MVEGTTLVRFAPRLTHRKRSYYRLMYPNPSPLLDEILGVEYRDIRIGIIGEICVSNAPIHLNTSVE